MGLPRYGERELSLECERASGEVVSGCGEAAVERE